VSPSNSVAGQPITFTANVEAADPVAGEPTGIVKILDTERSLGTAALGSPASLTTSLSAGPHQITARYSGDAQFAAATSDPVTVVVSPAAGDGGALPATR
jgi:hypothetical protein